MKNNPGNILPYCIQGSYILRGGKTMVKKNAMQLLFCIACACEIFIQSFRIIWLYFPSFLKKTVVYKLKEPKKTEMLLYFALFIFAMGYYIVVTADKIF